MNDEIKKKLEEIVDEGCSCDLMNGWLCEIHNKVRELEKLIEAK